MERGCYGLLNNTVSTASISMAYMKDLHPDWPLLSMDCNIWGRHEGKNGNRVEKELDKRNKLQIKIISFHNNSQARPCLK
jgi:hypothetical protein